LPRLALVTKTTSPLGCISSNTAKTFNRFVEFSLLGWAKLEERATFSVSMFELDQDQTQEELKDENAVYLH
jgi:hypothetical protein